MLFDLGGLGDILLDALEQVRIVQYWDAKGPFDAFTEYALDLIERGA